MPLRKGTTPRVLRGKNIPQKFMNIFISSFNKMYKQTKSDERAYTYAYGSMNKALHNAGYRKDTKTGKWSKSHEAIETPITYEAFMGKRITVKEEVTREEALREGLRFTGIAFIDHAVSQLGTGHERYYSPDFNDRCMENTNKFMELGHIVTMYNRHGSAYDTMFSMSTKNPIGRIESELRREGAHIEYDAFISPTEDGKEVIQLIFDKIMGESSVRMTEVSSVLQRLKIEGSEDDEEGEDYGYIEEMITARVSGIDMCDEAGITGAGIVRLLGEALTFAPYDEQEEDVEINWEELTTEELLENRKDLLDAHTASRLEALTKQFETLEAELATSKADLASAQAAAVAQPVRIAELELSLAIEQAAQGSVGKEIVKHLHEHGTSLEDIPEAVIAVRDEAIARVLAEAPSGKTTAKGAANLPKSAGSGDDDGGDEQFSEAQKRMMQLSSPSRR